MRDAEIKNENANRMPTSPKSLQPNHSIKNRTLRTPVPKHLPLLNLMQKLNSGSQERMILFLDHLASFLKLILVRLLRCEEGERTSGKSNEEEGEESGFSSSRRRSEQSILNAAATVWSIVSSRFFNRYLITDSFAFPRNTKYRWSTMTSRLPGHPSPPNPQLQQNNTI